MTDTAQTHKKPVLMNDLFYKAIKDQPGIQVFIEDSKPVVGDSEIYDAEGNEIESSYHSEHAIDEEGNHFAMFTLFGPSDSEFSTIGVVKIPAINIAGAEPLFEAMKTGTHYNVTKSASFLEENGSVSADDVFIELYKGSFIGVEMKCYQDSDTYAESSISPMNAKDDSQRVPLYSAEFPLLIHDVAIRNIVENDNGIEIELEENSATLEQTNDYQSRMALLADDAIDFSGDDEHISRRL